MDADCPEPREADAYFGAPACAVEWQPGCRASCRAVDGRVGGRLFPVGVSHFERWTMLEPILGYDFDAHAPAGVSDQQPAEGFQR